MSWLGVHYLMNTPELGLRVDDYLALINEGIAPLPAFEQGFGLTPDEFEKRIAAYWRANAFPIVKFRLGETIKEPVVEVRALSDAAADIARFEAQAIFRRDDRDVADTKRDIERALAEGGAEPRLYNHLMVLALKENDYARAVAVGRQAVAAFPDDPFALQTLGDALFHRYFGTGGPARDRADIDEAVAVFERQLAIDPTSPTANLHLPTASLAAGAAPTQIVVDAVSFNLVYHRSPSNFGVYLDGAEIMHRLGTDDLKCYLLGVVGPWIEAADAELDDEERARQVDTPLARMNRLGAQACAAEM